MLSKSMKKIHEYNLKNQPKEKIELINNIDGVKVYRRTNYLADIRVIPDRSLLGRLFFLEDYFCKKYDTVYDYLLVYKKGDKSYASQITQNMFNNSKFGLKYHIDKLKNSADE